MSLTLVEQGGFLNYTPFLQFIGTFCKPKAFKVGRNVFHRLDYFSKLIQKHKDTLDDPDRGFDFMYQYLLHQREQQRQGKTDTIFTDNQLMWLVSDLFIVGLDTTVTTLRWCCLFLLREPQVQQRLHEEIEAVIGSDRFPTYEDRLRMPYTEAFITEVFRFGSITPWPFTATRRRRSWGDTEYLKGHGSLETYGVFIGTRRCGVTRRTLDPNASWMMKVNSSDLNTSWPSLSDAVTVWVNHWRVSRPSNS
ncbi:hypothetical protein Pcinc_021142 [Petrolisthes cinctipes]|uniref:Cytochrome P450 n=1 Tax=Petrolisthes cinctipes TaxID=88211 RepID=A0AAE1FI14_PETCI|nr:hypothetical protein Pcinc_021142 [Petrolisthes cinctipes]